MVRGKAGKFREMSLECPPWASPDECPLLWLNPKRNPKRKDSTIYGTLVANSDTLDITCPVSLDAGLKKGHSYTVYIPFYTRASPWYDGEDFISFTNENGYDRIRSSWYSRLVRIGGKYHTMVAQSVPGLDECDVQNRVRVAVVNFEVDGDGEVMEFCQEGFGEYLVDHVVVVDNGPIGGGK